MPRASNGGGSGKAVRAGEAEIARNPRARSAVLRAAIRTDSPPRNWPETQRRAA